MTKKKVPRLRIPTPTENQTLKFIWKWKLANTMTLKAATAPAKSFWKFYQGLRRLMHEGYIKEIFNSETALTFWTLTKKGFLYLYGGNEAFREVRYQPQSVHHDYWASAFHLGDFVFGLIDNVQIVSEQELNALTPENLPPWVPVVSPHIPDGYTSIQTEGKKVILAFETELSAKTLTRYEDVLRYLDQHDEIDLVFWLCADDYLIERITTQLVALPRKNKAKNNFIRKSEFQNLGWQAPIVWGSKIKLSIREVMGQYGVNTLGKSGLTPGQPEAIDIFRSPIKSPKGLKP